MKIRIVTTILILGLMANLFASACCGPVKDLSKKEALVKIEKLKNEHNGSRFDFYTKLLKKAKGNRGFITEVFANNPAKVYQEKVEIILKYAAKTQYNGSNFNLLFLKVLANKKIAKSTVKQIASRLTKTKDKFKIETLRKKIEAL